VPSGKLILRDVYVAVDGHDVSRYCRDVMVSVNVEQIESTTVLDQQRTYLAGARTATVNLSFFSDAANDTILAAAVADPPVLVQIRPHQTAQGATNPAFEIWCVPLSDRWGGPIGDSAMRDLELAASGDIYENAAIGDLYDYALYDVSVYG